MPSFADLPPDLLAKAERRTWFNSGDALLILDWLAEANERFLGMDVAQKLEDGEWMLLIDPILDLSYQTDNCSALDEGRRFVNENEGVGRMFEPVWEGRFK
ncbi:hypothetical protein [Erythrobacter sp. R86502]|uniref:hypothetical protein n=1 Tax=Erythrobacter sp. R86502 TaxID=3093846 RepID=UPI0036D41B65